MDKILSAEEWIDENDNGLYDEKELSRMKLYSSYILEAFASDIIDASNVSYVNETRVNQLLTKFKEKL